jgi:DNA modification methylase
MSNKKIRPTDLKPDYSYISGDQSKNERIKFRHWNDLLYGKEKDEKDTTYSSIWLYRIAKEIAPFKDPLGSPSQTQAKKEGKEYFSEFNPLVAENIINFWSDEGDIILDPFAGRTRGIVAGLKHRKYYGFEISPIVYKAVKEVIDKGKEQFDEGYYPNIICDDSFNIDINNYSNEQLPQADLIFSCPPYWNLEKYESLPGQLSDIEDYKKFLERFTLIMKKSIDKLKDNGFICLVVGDFRKNDRLIPFDCDTTRLMEDLGVVLWDKVIIQNINFGWAGIKFGVAKHRRQTSKVSEYLLVFKKIVL